MDSADRGLRDLLLQEFYLSKVLACLVDDGLHECRRVCRLWKDACKRLPVKLSRVPSKQLTIAASEFPKATAVATTLSAEGAESGKGNPHMFDKGLQQIFQSWTQLRSLEVVLDGDWSDSTAPHYLLPSMTQLESLEIDFLCSAKDAARFCTGLQFLTNLESLKLTSAQCESLSIEALPSLEKLRELECDLEVLIDRNGHFLFPSATELETVSLDVSSWTSLHQTLPYIARVKALSLWFYVGDQQLVDWRFLKYMKKLESLSLGGAPIREESLVSVLKEIPLLKKLSLETRNEWTSALAESLKVLKGLEQLKVKPTYIRGTFPPPPAYPLSHMTHLWSLTLTIDAPVALDCMTQLRFLSVTQKKAGVIDWSNVLRCMSQLQSLTIEARDDAVSVRLPSFSLTKLKKLQSLYLMNVAVDAAFFAALSALPSLFFLQLDECCGFDFEWMKELNLIRPLRTLVLNGLDFVTGSVKEGSLPQLHYFRPHTKSMSQEDVENLTVRLPGLRRLL